ncbi:MAG: HAD-IIB family hydrolase [Desulfocapsaceae bacterium]|jgi:sucrose-phosphate synthase|nr:HAD-IIB family hydrolase [Desulfocapsaceae bacterium]
MNNSDGLYIQLFSIHGLIRGNRPELGRDADTGGQVKYVLELAKSLAAQEQVAQVDLVTRLIQDKNVGPEYSVRLEPLSDKARIVRLQCGGRKYIRKELLWPHMDEFIDKAVRFIRRQKKYPDVFHGHYADAGYVAAELSATFDTPFFFTGHSLGRNKKAKLLADGLSEVKMERLYKIGKRIDVEEDILKKADLIITSTLQEIEKQYGLYKNSRGRRFRVIPPGIDLETFYPYYDPLVDETMLNDDVKHTRMTIIGELHRFWSKPEKPFILALCRPDHRKNITGLIEAYGRNQQLRAVANLAVFAGIRSNIRTMEENEQAVLTDMLLAMDRYDLYGKLAIPKRHEFATEVPELYRLCAEHRGVFVNPTMVEPFGITLIEASACGVPIVATNDGGPVDIVSNCQNGILVDATQTTDIAEAISTILLNEETWETYSNNGITGVRNHYSWQNHSKMTLEALQEIMPAAREKHGSLTADAAAVKQRSFGQRLKGVHKLLIVDIDNTLVGDERSMKHLFQMLDEHHDDIAWGVSTGRSLELMLDAMTDYSIPMPDIAICSVGTEIYYAPDLRRDKGWKQHISHKWKPDEIKRALGDVPFLALQKPEGQQSHKISYYMADDYDYLAWVHQVLEREGLRCRAIFSHGQFLDILPARASKGKAVDYIMYKYEFSPRNVMVAGDSGNDADMLTGKARGLVVGNYSQELEKLRKNQNIYFSRKKYSAGIIDGLNHYGFV